MRMLSLSMTNFMPYKGENSIEFPTDPARNVMIVFGDNMRGKTSLLNALRWGFYGRALGRHMHEIELQDLINKEAAAEGDYFMEVRARFEADGHSYDLRRRAEKKEHVAFPSRPEDFNVQFSLQKDNMVVSGHQIEAEINRYVPEQVSRFFLFDGELLQEYEALLYEGSEQGKKIKEAIEQVLGVPTLIQGRHEVETILKQAQKQQTKDLQQMQGLEAQAARQAGLQEKQASKERSVEDLKGKLKEIRDQREVLDDDLEKVEEIYRAQTRSKDIEKRQNAILERQDSIAAERMALAKAAWIDLLQPKLKVKQDQLLDEQKRVSDILAKKGRIEGKIEDLGKLLEDFTCPTCGQALGGDRKVKVETDLGILRAEAGLMSADSDALGKISSEIRDVGKLIRSGVGADLRKLSSEDKGLSVELTQIDNEKEQIDELIRGHDTDAIANKRRLRDSLMRQEGGIEKDIDNAENELKGIKNELEILSKAIANLPAARAKRSTAKVALCQQIMKAFSESVERLRDDLRNKVEKKATDAFKHLTTQKKYRGLEINENYGLTILDENGDRVGIRSAGAEQIVALSLIDGLARTGRAAGPVVMDTPFGRLDLNHRDNILRYLPETTSQLVLLVHDGEIRKDTDLAPVASRVGKAYVIREVSPRHSKIEVQSS